MCMLIQSIRDISNVDILNYCLYQSLNMPLDIPWKSIQLYYACINFYILNAVPRPCNCTSPNETAVTSHIVRSIQCWQNGTVLAGAVYQDIETEGQYMPQRKRKINSVRFSFLLAAHIDGSCKLWLFIISRRKLPLSFKNAYMHSTRKRRWHRIFSLSSPGQEMVNWQCLHSQVGLLVDQGFPWMAF